MNEGLEYIQRQINLVKQQVKGSKMRIIVTDPVTQFQYDYYERELQTLESIENKLKALEIIKDKEVNIHWLKICETLEMYNKNTSSWEKQLTKEEFKLLKEVLDNGTD